MLLLLFLSIFIVCIILIVFVVYFYNKVKPIKTTKQPIKTTKQPKITTQPVSTIQPVSKNNTNIKPNINFIVTNQEGSFTELIKKPNLRKSVKDIKRDINKNFFYVYNNKLSTKYIKQVYKQYNNDCKIPNKISDILTNKSTEEEIKSNLDFKQTGIDMSKIVLYVQSIGPVILSYPSKSTSPNIITDYSQKIDFSDDILGIANYINYNSYIIYLKNIPSSKTSYNIYANNIRTNKISTYKIDINVDSSINISPSDISNYLISSETDNRKYKKLYIGQEIDLSSCTSQCSVNCGGYDIGTGNYCNTTDILSDNSIIFISGVYFVRTMNINKNSDNNSGFFTITNFNGQQSNNLKISFIMTANENDSANPNITLQYIDGSDSLSKMCGLKIFDKTSTQKYIQKKFILDKKNNYYISEDKRQIIIPKKCIQNMNTIADPNLSITFYDKDDIAQNEKLYIDNIPTNFRLKRYPYSVPIDMIMNNLDKIETVESDSLNINLYLPGYIIYNNHSDMINSTNIANISEVQFILYSDDIFTTTPAPISVDYKNKFPTNWLSNNVMQINISNKDLIESVKNMNKKLLCLFGFATKAGYFSTVYGVLSYSNNKFFFVLKTISGEGISTQYSLYTDSNKTINVLTDGYLPNQQTDNLNLFDNFDKSKIDYYSVVRNKGRRLQNKINLIYNSPEFRNIIDSVTTKVPSGRRRRLHDIGVLLPLSEDVLLPLPEGVKEIAFGAGKELIKDTSSIIKYPLGAGSGTGGAGAVSTEIGAVAEGLGIDLVSTEVVTGAAGEIVSGGVVAGEVTLEVGAVATTAVSLPVLAIVGAAAAVGFLLYYFMVGSETPVIHQIEINNGVPKITPIDPSGVKVFPPIQPTLPTSPKPYDPPIFDLEQSQPVVEYGFFDNTLPTFIKPLPDDYFLLQNLTSVLNLNDVGIDFQGGANVDVGIGVGVMVDLYADNDNEDAEDKNKKKKKKKKSCSKSTKSENIVKKAFDKVKTFLPSYITNFIDYFETSIDELDKIYKDVLFVINATGKIVDNISKIDDTTNIFSNNAFSSDNIISFSKPNDTNQVQSYLLKFLSNENFSETPSTKCSNTLFIKDQYNIIQKINICYDNSKDSKFTISSDDNSVNIYTFDNPFILNGKNINIRTLFISYSKDYTETLTDSSTPIPSISQQESKIPTPEDLPTLPKLSNPACKQQPKYNVPIYYTLDDLKIYGNNAVPNSDLYLAPSTFKSNDKYNVDDSITLIQIESMSSLYDYDYYCPKGQIVQKGETNTDGIKYDTYTCVPEGTCPVINKCVINKDSKYLGGYNGCGNFFTLKNITDKGIEKSDGSSIPIIWSLIKNNIQGETKYSNKYKVIIDESLSNINKNDIKYILRSVDGDTNKDIKFFTNIRRNIYESAITILEDFTIDGKIISKGAIFMLDPNTNRYVNRQIHYVNENNEKSNIDLIYIFPITNDKDGVTGRDLSLSYVNDNDNCGWYGNKCPEGTKCCGQKCININENTYDDYGYDKCYTSCGVNEINVGGKCVSRDNVYADGKCKPGYANNNIGGICEPTCPVGKEGWSSKLAFKLQTLNDYIYINNTTDSNGRVVLSKSFTTINWYYTSDGKILNGSDVSKGLTVDRKDRNLEGSSVILSNKPDYWIIDNNNSIRLVDNPSYALVNFQNKTSDGTPIVLSQSFIKWEIEGKNACDSAPVGKYIDKNNTAQTCPAGSYCPGGLSYQCPAGSYCPIGSVLPQPCPIGSYCPVGSSSYISCPPGSYSSAGSSQCTACPVGFYCSNDSENPKPCPVGSFCPPSSNLPISCVPGQYCDEKSVVFTYCPAGFYCPDGKQKIQCPSGSFCPDRSIQPTKCPPNANCETGSKYPIFKVDKVSENPLDMINFRQYTNLKYPCGGTAYNFVYVLLIPGALILPEDVKIMYGYDSTDCNPSIRQFLASWKQSQYENYTNRGIGEDIPQGIPGGFYALTAGYYEVIIHMKISNIYTGLTQFIRIYYHKDSWLTVEIIDSLDDNNYDKQRVNYNNYKYFYRDTQPLVVILGPPLDTSAERLVRYLDWSGYDCEASDVKRSTYWQCPNPNSEKCCAKNITSYGNCNYNSNPCSNRDGTYLDIGNPANDLNTVKSTAGGGYYYYSK